MSGRNLGPSQSTSREKTSTISPQSSPVLSNSSKQSNSKSHSKTGENSTAQSWLNQLNRNLEIRYVPQTVGPPNYLDPQYRANVKVRLDQVVRSLSNGQVTSIEHLVYFYSNHAAVNWSGEGGPTFSMLSRALQKDLESSSTGINLWKDLLSPQGKGILESRRRERPTLNVGADVPVRVSVEVDHRLIKTDVTPELKYNRKTNKKEVVGYYLDGYYEGPVDSPLVTDTSVSKRRKLTSKTGQPITDLNAAMDRAREVIKNHGFTYKTDGPQPAAATSQAPLNAKQLAKMDWNARLRWVTKDIFNLNSLGGRVGEQFSEMIQSPLFWGGVVLFTASWLKGWGKLAELAAWGFGAAELVHIFTELKKIKELIDRPSVANMERAAELINGLVARVTLDGLMAVGGYAMKKFGPNNAKPNKPAETAKAGVSPNTRTTKTEPASGNASGSTQNSIPKSTVRNSLAENRNSPSKASGVSPKTNGTPQATLENRNRSASTMNSVMEKRSAQVRPEPLRGQSAGKNQPLREKTSTASTATKPGQVRIIKRRSNPVTSHESRGTGGATSLKKPRKENGSAAQPVQKALPGTAPVPTSRMLPAKSTPNNTAKPVTVMSPKLQQALQLERDLPGTEWERFFNNLDPVTRSQLDTAKTGQGNIGQRTPQAYQRPYQYTTPLQNPLNKAEVVAGTVTVYTPGKVPRQIQIEQGININGGNRGTHAGKGSLQIAGEIEGAYKIMVTLPGNKIGAFAAVTLNDPRALSYGGPKNTAYLSHVVNSAQDIRYPELFSHGPVGKNSTVPRAVSTLLPEVVAIARDNGQAAIVFYTKNFKAGEVYTGTAKDLMQNGSLSGVKIWEHANSNWRISLAIETPTRLGSPASSTRVQELSSTAIDNAMASLPKTGEPHTIQYETANPNELTSFIELGQAYLKQGRISAYQAIRVADRQGKPSFILEMQPKREGVHSLEPASPRNAKQTPQTPPVAQPSLSERVRLLTEEGTLSGFTVFKDRSLTRVALENESLPRLGSPAASRKIGTLSEPVLQNAIASVRMENPETLYFSTENPAEVSSFVRMAQSFLEKGRVDAYQATRIQGKNGKPAYLLEMKPKPAKTTPGLKQPESYLPKWPVDPRELPSISSKAKNPPRSGSGTSEPLTAKPSGVAEQAPKVPLAPDQHNPWQLGGTKSSAASTTTAAKPTANTDVIPNQSKPWWQRLTYQSPIDSALNATAKVVGNLSVRSKDALLKRIKETLPNSPLFNDIKVAKWVTEGVLRDSLTKIADTPLGKTINSFYGNSGVHKTIETIYHAAEVTKSPIKIGRDAAIAVIARGLTNGQTQHLQFKPGDTDLTPLEKQIARRLALPKNVQVDVWVAPIPGMETTNGYAIIGGFQADHMALPPGMPGQPGTAQAGGVIGKTTSFFPTAGWYGPSGALLWNFGTENFGVGQYGRASLLALTANLPKVEMDWNRNVTQTRVNEVSVAVSASPLNLYTTDRFTVGPINYMDTRISGPLNLATINFLDLIGLRNPLKVKTGVTGYREGFINGNGGFNPNGKDVEAVGKAMNYILGPIKHLLSPAQNSEAQNKKPATKK
ncbi:hypothetical protein SAMN06265795_11325 [Noviherbaspirillum humi]|uniref:Uncharacterized protein n=1 Tax=Noviherbaspirillum humi TaxID=1688639 RepID=A0A239JR97_9BURK|nr:hypothetical protein [Noviherbaspirillum humi]SNT07294.1 hypothetical protein SAMN06265795_11325 [Noviherbaspirillum humi]